MDLGGTKDAVRPRRAPRRPSRYTPDLLAPRRVRTPLVRTSLATRFRNAKAIAERLKRQREKKAPPPRQAGETGAGQRSGPAVLLPRGGRRKSSSARDRAAAHPFIEEGNEAISFRFSRRHVLNHARVSKKQKREPVQRLQKTTLPKRQLESHVQLIFTFHLY